MRKNEKASALVAALGLIFMGGMLTASVLALSRIGTFNVSAHLDRQRSMYVMEGAANRIQWLLAADRYLYDDVTLGELDYSEYDHDRYVADGRPHVIDYYGNEVVFVITDTSSGFPLSKAHYARTLSRLTTGFEEDTAWTDSLTEYRDKLDDYTDSDTDVRTDGMEEGEYEELNLYNLPRNAALQFREELLWIPDTRKLFPVDRNGRLSRIMLIPPENTVTLPEKPSLLTADALLLRTYCNLDEDEANEVLDCLRRVKYEGELLSDILDPLISARLSGLAVKESGFYTVEMRLSEETKKPSAKLIFSFEGFGVGGPSDEIVRYLDWMMF